MHESRQKQFDKFRTIREKASRVQSKTEGGSMLRKLTILSVALLCTYAGAVHAQASSPAPEATPAAPPTATNPPPPATDVPVVADTTPRRALEEEVVVTGSRIRRKDLTTPAPVTVITHEQIEQSGKMTIGDFLQAMPEQGNAPNFQLNTGGINYGADGTTRINLRSLGIQRTLVLINGRRVVPGGLGASAAVDLNTIPAEVVDRIEVLKDGASALYGSDAISGVVNIITKRNYNQTDVGVEYGVSGHGDAQTFEAHGTTGFSNEKSSAIFSVRYFNQKDSLLGARDWAAQALDYDYTGGGPSASGSSRVPQGALRIPEDPNNPGHPLCNGNALCQTMTNALGWKPTQRYIRDPSAPTCGQNALGQTECFRLFGSKAAANDNTGNDFYNFAAVNYLSIPSTTIQAFSSGDTKFNPAVRGYYEVGYTTRSSTQNAAPMPLNPADYNNIVVSKNSLYNPFGVDLNFLGRRLVEFGNRTYTEDLGTFRVVAGFDGVLPSSAGPLSGWIWDASMNYGRTSGTFTTGGSFRNSRVANAVGPSMLDASGNPVCVSTPGDITTVIPGCTPLNLLGGPGSIAQSQQAYLGYTGTSRAFDALYTIDASLAGELFNLASDQPVALALGYEFRRQSGAQIADPIVNDGDSADFNFKSTSGYYTANEAFAELSIPILSQMSGVEALEADVAGRYVNYSTFGGNFSYKIGARYTPIRDLTVRGTYSTAFRAPNISELYLGATETDPAATDPCADFSTVPAATKAQCQKFGVKGSGSGDSGLQELTRQGGNAALQPETAKTWTVGIVITPRMLPNFSFTMDYYNIVISNAIATIGTANILNGCYVNLNDSYCQLVVRNNAGTIQYVNDLNQNIAEKSTAGVDFAIRYGIPTTLGRFQFQFDGNVLGYYDSTLHLATGDQVIHGKDTFDLGVNPAFKANAGLDYISGGFVLGAIGRYIGSFTECSNPSDPTTAAGGLCWIGNDQFNPLNRRVHSYFQLDLHASYVIKNTFGKTAIFAGISNVLDQQPPYIYSAPLANSDPSAYDYLGRYFYARVQQTF
jgi:outer membrane receptor protein involved in Fe transport